VVLEHVPERAGAVVVTRAPSLDAQILCDGDLHQLDVVSVPERLEDGVVESEGEEILDGLFSEVVVDPIDLVLP